MALVTSKNKMNLEAYSLFLHVVVDGLNKDHILKDPLLLDTGFYLGISIITSVSVLLR